MNDGVKFCHARRIGKGEVVLSAPRDSTGDYMRIVKRSHEGAIVEIVYIGGNRK